jgi:hypothetical protein
MRVMMDIQTITHRTIQDTINLLKTEAFKLHVLGENPQPFTGFPIQLLSVMISQYANENNVKETEGIYQIGILSCDDKYDDELQIVNIIPNAIDEGAAERVLHKTPQLYGI